MTLKKTIGAAPGKKVKHVNLTTQERAERQTEEAQHSMNKWKKEMKESDKSLPRYVEDIIDVLTVDQKAALASETVTAYNNKKTKRTQRPK